MYISTTPTTKQTLQATNPKQSNPQSSLSNKFHHSDPVHSFNVKPIKMLSDPVAGAFGLIHRHPSGENFWHGMATRIYTESFLLKMGVFNHKCSELNMVLNLEIIQLLHSRESSGEIIISSLK